jgi:hypothetical protein
MLLAAVCSWLLVRFCARGFVIVDDVTFVNLPYLVAERTAELNKNSIHEDICRVTPYAFL